MDNRLQEELLMLRKRVKDLLELGYLTAEAAGTYEQTILQAWQEADRRRAQLRQKAETLRLQAAAADAEASAFGTVGSILYNIVNGFVENGRKRLAEEAERARELEERAKSDAAETQSAQPDQRRVNKRGKKT